jgi:hypothetical protein
MHCMRISWKHEHTELNRATALDKKIEIFREKIWGWQLHVADLMINKGRNHEDTADVNDTPHSAFAALQVALSYFEMIARYEAGDCGKDQSRDFFIRGFLSVFPEANNFPYTPTREFLNLFYSGARCGLYHLSMTAPGVVIGKTGTPIRFTQTPTAIEIDPHELIPAMKRHFLAYIERLKNPAETELRARFENRFDRDHPTEKAVGK